MADYYKILLEIKLLKAEIIKINIDYKAIDGWLPRKIIMKFFDVGDTTMAALEKKTEIEVSKIGKRKFYKLDSIQKLLENNKLNKNIN